MSKLARMLLIVSCTAGCGYFAGGSWNDDSRNWTRAFDTSKPPDVVVVHSTYSRFPHWSYEYEYYFHIAANADLSRQILGKNRLARVDTAWARPLNAPEWFAPKGFQQYETWAFTGDPQRAFRVLVDRSSGDLFITDQQL
jgi:hypothetical protein